MEIDLFVRLRARTGHGSALRQVILEVLAPSRQEPGCLMIKALHSVRDPLEYYIHSRWRSQADFDHHASLIHTQNFLEKAAALIDHPLSVTLSQEIDR